MGFGCGVFEMLLEVAEGLQAVALVFADPALVDFVDGDGVEVVELFAAVPDGGDEIGVLEEVQVLGNSLTAHIEVLAESGESLAVVFVQQVEQLAAAGIGQGFEHVVHDGDKLGNQMVACQRPLNLFCKIIFGECPKQAQPFVERRKRLM